MKARSIVFQWLSDNYDVDTTAHLHDITYVNHGSTKIHITDEKVTFFIFRGINCGHVIAKHVISISDPELFEKIGNVLGPTNIVK